MALINICAKVLIIIISASKSDSLNLIGIGATFPSDIYQSWVSYYASSRFGYAEIRQKYNARGSDAGLIAMMQTLSYGTPVQSPFLIEDRLTDFGTSEVPYPDKELANYTDLITFPVLAGALVLAYNVPEVDNLVLTLDHVIGIYNGTIKFWNDSTFAAQNDKYNFPNASIKPVARYFTSGSTYMLTKSLSTYSSAWRYAYGSFATRTGWPKEPNFEFGQKSTGMIDTILNLQYSIGYVPVWLAESSNIRYASLVNRYNETVSPKSIKSLQNSVEANKLKLLSSKYFISDLIETSQTNYPIVGYSYMIVKLSAIVACLEAVELARFIKWVSLSVEANSFANSFYMVNAAKGIADDIDFRVIKRMTCGKKLVQDLLTQQMNEEDEMKKTWKTPLGVSIPICLLIAGGVGFGVWRQRRKYMKMIDKNEWNINPFEIEFNIEKHIGINNSNMNKVKHRNNQINTSLDGFRPTSPLKDSSKSKFVQKQKSFVTNGSIVGKYNEIRMCFTPLWLEGHFDTNVKVRLALTRMRSSLDHTNLLRFYGLTWMNDRLYLAEEHGEKGPLIDMLRNTKFDLSDEFRYSVTRDIASALSYLHHKDVVHGFLTTDSCVVDSKWTIKVRGWSYNLIYQTNKIAGKAKTNQNIYDIRRQQLNHVDQKQFEFWTPPEAEMAKGKDFTPTKACDSFCFGLVMSKIFTTLPLRVVMHKPSPANPVSPAQTTDNNNTEEFGDKNHTLPSRLAKVEGIQTLSAKVRVIIGQACTEEPSQRPSFEKLTVMLKAAHNSKHTSTLDNIIEFLERYGSETEAKLDDMGKRLRRSLDEKDKIISQRIPEWAMSQLRIGKEVDCKLSKHVTVAALQIDLNQLEAALHNSDDDNALNKLYERNVISCLDTFHLSVDEIVDENSWLFKIEQTSGDVILVAGFNGFTFNQNIGRMVEMLWKWIDVIKTRCEEAVSGHDDFNQHHTSTPLLFVTLHEGSAIFGVNKPSGNPTNVKFFSCGEAIKRAQRLNSSRCFNHGINQHRILCTDAVFKNLQTTLKNFKVSPANILNEILSEAPLYWIEKESETKQPKIPDVVC